jgi:hypothetical protein
VKASVFCYILVAYLITRAVIKGAGNIRAPKLQALSVALAIGSVFVSNLAIIFYLTLKNTGEQGNIFYALVGFFLTPSNWLPMAKAMAMSQGPVGWFIIALTIYFAYKYSDPKVAVVQNIKSDTVSKSKPVEFVELGQVTEQTAREIISDEERKKISRQFTTNTLLYISCVIICFVIGFSTSVPGVMRVIVVLVFGYIAGILIRNTRALKQRYPSVVVQTEKKNNQLNWKRTILIALGLFILIMGVLALLVTFQK